LTQKANVRVISTESSAYFCLLQELFDKQKELILLGERVVLATLEFDLNIHHAYKPLVEAIRRFNVGDINNFPQVAWSFVNDGYASATLNVLSNCSPQLSTSLNAVHCTG
jgi:hypothetical protein